MITDRFPSYHIRWIRQFTPFLFFFHTICFHSSECAAVFTMLMFILLSSIQGRFCRCRIAKCLLYGPPNMTYFLMLDTFFGMFSISLCPDYYTLLYYKDILLQSFFFFTDFSKPLKSHILLEVTKTQYIPCSVDFLCFDFSLWIYLKFMNVSFLLLLK